LYCHPDDVGAKFLRNGSSYKRHTATRRNIPEDAILHKHRRENLKSYTVAILTALPVLKENLSEAKALMMQSHL
jgi:hypothetical protein